MNNRCSTLLICLLAGASLLSCRSVKDPELKGFENLRFGRLGLQQSSLSFDIVFFNPNNYRVKIKEANGDLWMDGNPLGHFTVDTLVRIPANGNFRLPVRLKMDMRHFVENISAALMDKQVKMKVDGMARAGKGWVFINYPLRYEQKLKLSELLK